MKHGTSFSRASALRLLCRLTPALFCLLVYWAGLKAWFQQDDFVWLSQRQEVTGGLSLWAAIFRPSQHGTFRPLSERVFFLLSDSLFPLDALPAHLLMFLTQFANLTLLSLVVRRLTGSAAAGFLAPVLWVANSNLAMVMVWASAYMQILCGFCLLLAFHFFLLHLETGRRRWYLWQWVPYLTGFLVLETTVVYPLFVLLYLLLLDRKRIRKALPLFVPALMFTVLHMRFIPKEQTGTYAIHLDLSIFRTLYTYWRLTFEPRNFTRLTGMPAWMPELSALVVTIGLAAFILWRLRQRQWLPVFFAGWYCSLLAPVLPLRDHISDYLLALPVMALASLMAHALVRTFFLPRSVFQRPVQGLVAVAAALYLTVSVPAAWQSTRWWSARSIEAKQLLLGVKKARRLHPDKAIVLEALGGRLYWAAVVDGGFQYVGAQNVYLAPGSEAVIPAAWGGYQSDLAALVVPREVFARALKRNQAVVYEVSGGWLVDVTSEFQEIAPHWNETDLPRYVNATNPLLNYLFGPSWYAPEAGRHRWMPQKADLRMRGPEVPGQVLQVKGACGELLLAHGPALLRVSIDGKPAGQAEIGRPGHFSFDFPLPPEATEKREIRIDLEVDRSFRAPQDGRELTLVFGSFAIR